MPRLKIEVPGQMKNTKIPIKLVLTLPTFMYLEWLALYNRKRKSEIVEEAILFYEKEKNKDD